MIIQLSVRAAQNRRSSTQISQPHGGITSRRLRGGVHPGEPGASTCETPGCGAPQAAKVRRLADKERRRARRAEARRMRRGRRRHRAATVASTAASSQTRWPCARPERGSRLAAPSGGRRSFGGKGRTIHASRTIVWSRSKITPLQKSLRSGRGFANCDTPIAEAGFARSPNLLAGDHQKKTHPKIPKFALGTSFLSEHRARLFIWRKRPHNSHFTQSLAAKSLRSKITPLTRGFANCGFAEPDLQVSESPCGRSPKKHTQKFQNLSSAPHSSPNTVLGCSFGGKGRTIHTIVHNCSFTPRFFSDLGSRISDLGSRISDLVGVKSRCDGLQQPHSKKGMVDLRSVREILAHGKASSLTCSAISRPKIRRYPPPESPGSPCRARPCATC